MRRIVLFPWLVRLLANKKMLDIKFFKFKLRTQLRTSYRSAISGTFLLETCLTHTYVTTSYPDSELILACPPRRSSSWSALSVSPVGHSCLSVGVCDEQSVLFAITGGVTLLPALLAKDSCPHIAHWQENSCLVLTTCCGGGLIFRFSLGAKCVRYDPRQ